MTAPPDEQPAAPLSRRALREARQTGARTATETGPVDQDATASPAVTAPIAPVQIPVEPTASVRPAASGLTAPSEVGVPADDDWIFGRAAAPVTPGGARTPQPRVESAPLEDLFSGAKTTDDLGAPPPPTDRRKRRIGGWIAFGVVLVILGGITVGGLWVWNTYEPQIRELMGWQEPMDYEDGLANGEALLTIESGDTGRSISTKLYEAGVTMTDEAFYDYLIETGQNPNFVPGVFALQKQMTSEAALAAILDPANRRENTAQIREGLTQEQTLTILSESLGMPLEDFEAAAANPADYGVAADSLEGWLFPATYTFNPGVTAADVVRTLVDRAVQSLDAAGVPLEDRQRILTVASIIQREARYVEDMQKVSRVIVNRLDPGNQETFGLLQMDSTAQYGFGEMHDGTASTSAEAQYDDNPWNTYVHAGLPIGPIANPGDDAIYAAMNPADGDWLYFVTVNLDTGETVFTSNLADHERARQQWLDWCGEHPDSGC